jgi:hypothetical protein
VAFERRTALPTDADAYGLPLNEHARTVRASYNRRPYQLQNNGSAKEATEGLGVFGKSGGAANHAFSVHSTSFWMPIE